MKDVAQNRQAFHNYEILEKFEAGVALRGRLPLCRASNPPIRFCSKRAFQRAIVGREVFSSASIRL